MKKKDEILVQLAQEVDIIEERTGKIPKEIYLTEDEFHQCLNAVYPLNRKHRRRIKCLESGRNLWFREIECISLYVGKSLPMISQEIVEKKADCQYSIPSVLWQRKSIKNK